MSKGVLLAGGLGTRLRPLTRITNKHLLPVYNKPMIEYPLQTLIDTGCRDILIVTGSEHVGDFAEYLGDGSRYKVRLTYRVQEEAGGIAQALAVAENFVDYGTFPVILGDNYFSIPPFVPPTPAIFTKHMPGAHRFGVYTDRHITEKPHVEEGEVVLGFYVFDSRVFQFIRTLTPSDRGELEITDVNNWYLKQNMAVYEYKGDWSDMGTFDSLLAVSNKFKGRS